MVASINAITVKFWQLIGIVAVKMSKITVFIAVAVAITWLSCADAAPAHWCTEGNGAVWREELPQGHTPVHYCFDFVRFLRNRKAVMHSNKKRVFILGNEGGDIDSAVSALGLAYFYHLLTPAERELYMEAKYIDAEFIPVFNVERSELHLRTEVNKYLKDKMHFTDEELSELITISDVFPNETVSDRETFRYILVDHSQTSDPILIPQKHVINIIDHHHVSEFDRDTIERTMRFKRLAMIGSCATLVAELVVEHLRQPTVDHAKFNSLLVLLFGAILVDNIEHDLEVAIPKPRHRDAVMYKYIIDNVTRDNWKQYSIELNDSKKVTGDLTAYDLLCRDLKFLWKNDVRITRENRIAVAMVPVSAEAFLQWKKTKTGSVAGDVRAFMSAPRKQCNLVIIMGRQFTRDLAFIPKDIHSSMAHDYFTALVNPDEEELRPGLSMRPKDIPSEWATHGILLQEELTDSNRKVILPKLDSLLNRKL